MLFLIPCLEVGGAERLVLALAADAVGRGARVAVAAAPGALCAELPSGVEFVPLAVSRAPGAQLANIRTLTRFGADFRPTAVNSHHFLLAAQVRTAMLLARQNALHVLTIHGPERRIYVPIIGFAGPLVASRVLTVSRDVAERLLRYRWPWSRTPIDVIYAGCADPRSGVEVRRAAGVVARLVDVKGHRYLIDAWRLLTSRGRATGWMLEVWGDGPLRAELEQRVRHAALGDSVLFRGTVMNTPAHVGELSIVVLPSLSEALPLALMEAMAAGRPIIASDLPGVRELVGPSDAAVLVPPADPRRLADALEYLIADATVRTRLGEAARQRHREAFTLDAFGAAYGTALGYA